jgi:hypothetical protein
MAESAKENMMSGIKDKVVAITGASSGIGEATEARRPGVL